MTWADYMREHGAQEYELWEKLMQGKTIPSGHSEIDSAGDNAEERSAMGNVKSSDQDQSERKTMTHDDALARALHEDREADTFGGRPWEFRDAKR